MVVAICFDAAHAAELKKATLTRLKDALLSADGLFGHADLAKRAALLAVENKPQKRKQEVSLESSSSAASSQEDEEDEDCSGASRFVV